MIANSFRIGRGRSSDATGNIKMATARTCKWNNIVTCLCTICLALVFCLFALYKYTLVDADAVMRKNWMFSNSFDYDDYGIDVSELRNAHSEGKNELTSVEKWDALVKKDAGVRMAYVTDDCEHPTAIYGISYVTKESRGNLKVVVRVNYTAEREIAIGGGEAVISAMFGKAVVLNQTMELCSLDEEMINCPIKKGFREYKREVTLPKFAPKGRYHGMAYLRYSDTKEVQLCARGRFIL